MKNFFKKLALVLALALVVTVVAPAAASNSEAASVALKTKSAKVSIGKSYDFNLKNKVKGSTYKWTSSNKKVATVNAKNGLTKGVAVGTATISCKITLPNKTTKTVKATFTVCPDATAVAISNPIEKVDLGSSYDFNRTMTPSNSVNKTYWIVKDASGKEVANTRTGVGAAIMSSKGVFTPDTIGTFTITAECWRSKTATVKRAESAPLTVKVALPRLETIAIQEATYDDDTKGQELTLLVNGKTAKSSALKESGYTVTFTAYEADGTTVSDALLKDTSSGVGTNAVLKDTVTVGTYKVKVTASKLGEYATSSLATIKVENLNAAVASVIGAVYKTDNTGELKKGQAVVGEAVTLDKLTFMQNGKKKTINATDHAAEIAKVKLTSSNPGCLAVSGQTLTPKAPGTATVTAKYGNQTFTTSFTVNQKARRPKTVVAKDASKTIAVTTTNPTTVASFMVYDQYGETLKANTNFVLTANPTKDNLKAKVSNPSVLTLATTSIVETANKDGQYDVNVSAAAKGTSTVTLEAYQYDQSNDSMVSAASTTVTVTTNADVSKVEAYVKQTTDDGYSSNTTLVLDGNSKAKLAVRGLNNENVSLGDQEITTFLSKNEKVVKLSKPVDGGGALDTSGNPKEIEIQAVGTGTTALILGTAKGEATITITVTGTALELKGVTTKTETLTHKDATVKLEDLFYGQEDKKSGNDFILDKSKLNTSRPIGSEVDVRLDKTTAGAWKIYIDEDGDGDLTSADTELATVGGFEVSAKSDTVTFTETMTAGSSTDVTATIATCNAGDTATLNAYVKNPAGDVVAIIQVNVNIPK